ncbi:nitroreductase/quinone reductase family protein [Pseudonocardia alaniniphila]|uniref:Nitroreductase/quinone reductase family protein n=1 Tax=Pseudonocardia alaniniphila TaxID=75291 RepID=A0ABS9TEG5_9PSEU|nr:nitroreductase/quinone reductase family protein [Pseudonocardia alaniniphila]MCH6166917.1 nitroreductase/quinone reductase family protein [Pseudonocardia alaniniphila]
MDPNREVIDEFRANSGRVPAALGGMFKDANLLLLTTTGARSGRPSTTPAAFAEDAGRLIIFATNAGHPQSPAWLHNLRANPTVIVEIGDTRYDALATEVTGAERDRLYHEQATREPAFAAYQQNTSRVIQVVALTPARVGAATAQLKEIHAGLRKQLDDTLTAVDTYLAGNGQLPESANELQRHCLSFCGALHAHHSREGSAFPRLAADFPELEPALDHLTREHEAVAALNVQITETLDLLTAAPSREVAVRLRDDLHRLAEDLDEHYAYEEAHLGPALDAA